MSKKCNGFRPEVEDVEKFLYGISHPSTPEPRPTPPSSPRTFPIQEPSVSAPSGDGYINKQIVAFTLLGKEHRPRNWKELMVTVAEEMYRRHPAEIDRALRLRGSKMAYFGLSSNELSQPSRVSDSKYFVETKINTNSIVRRCRELLSLFGYSDSDLTIEAR